MAKHLLSLMSSNLQAILPECSKFICDAPFQESSTAIDRGNIVRWRLLTLFNLESYQLIPPNLKRIPICIHAECKWVCMGVCI